MAILSKLNEWFFSSHQLELISRIDLLNANCIEILICPI